MLHEFQIPHSKFRIARSLRIRHMAKKTREQSAAGSRSPSSAAGSRSPSSTGGNRNRQTPVDSIKHKDSRVNIPTEELRDFVADDERAPKTMLYPRDPSLDPQPVW